MSLKEDLLAVKTLIGTKETWTQDALARRNDGLPCPPTSPYACKWCLMGALHYVYAGQTNTVFDDALYHLIRTTEDMSEYSELAITQVNDMRGFEAVHKILDVAIETTP